MDPASLLQGTASVFNGHALPHSSSVLPYEFAMQQKLCLHEYYDLNYLIGTLALKSLPMPDKDKLGRATPDTFKELDAQRQADSQIRAPEFNNFYERIAYHLFGKMPKKKKPDYQLRAQQDVVSRMKEEFIGEKTPRATKMDVLLALVKQHAEKDGDPDFCVSGYKTDLSATRVQETLSRIYRYNAQDVEVFNNTTSNMYGHWDNQHLVTPHTHHVDIMRSMHPDYSIAMHNALRVNVVEAGQQYADQVMAAFKESYELKEVEHFTAEPKAIPKRASRVSLAFRLFS